MLLLNIIDIIRTHILSLIHTCDLYTNMLFFTKPRRNSHALNLIDIVSLLQPWCHSQGHVVAHEDMYALLTYTWSAILKIHSVSVSRGRSLQGERYLVIVLV